MKNSRLFMSISPRAAGLLALVLTLISVFTGCGGAPKDISKMSCDDVLKYLAKDFKVSDKNSMMAAFIGAVEGVKATLAGYESVEIYRFDVSNAEKKAELDAIQASGMFSMGGFLQVKAFVKGPFVVIYRDFPDPDKLAAALQKL
ncbi:MAG: hypothetical protein LBD37_10900 [Treponema sp.]|jgi:hypothetical protein|nr:hypothetical protein [Treponema sp.]